MINRTESFSTIIGTGDRGPMWMVRVRERETGRWWYVKNYRNGEFTWTRDPLYGKLYSQRRAKQVQGEIASDTTF